ncbi:MAG: hypothetical protein MUF44_04275 [Hydrogenophaga sp.]|jgi:hypothetical protein|nr:hypothetical protein [Hydrogenophaga sp.]
MARQRKPPTQAEVDAIKAAEKEWLRWRSIVSMLPPSIGGLQAETELRKATKALQHALEPYWQNPASAEAVRLVYAMQSIQLHRAPQCTYQQMLEDLIEPLQLLQWAAATLSKKGQPPAENVVRWVCMAADAWTAAGLPKPTGKGRFFRALEDADLNRTVPAVTPERVQHALTQWKKIRQHTAG